MSIKCTVKYSSKMTPSAGLSAMQKSVDDNFGKGKNQKNKIKMCGYVSYDKKENGPLKRSEHCVVCLAWRSRRRMPAGVVRPSWAHGAARHRSSWAVRHARGAPLISIARCWLACNPTHAHTRTHTHTHTIILLMMMIVTKRACCDEDVKCVSTLITWSFKERAVVSQYALPAVPFSTRRNVIYNTLSRQGNETHEWGAHLRQQCFFACLGRGAHHSLDQRRCYNPPSLSAHLPTLPSLSMLAPFWLVAANMGLELPAPLLLSWFSFDMFSTSFI